LFAIIHKVFKQWGRKVSGRVW